MARITFLLAMLASGRVLGVEELVLDVVNSYTKTLPPHVRYVSGVPAAEKAAMRTAEVRGGRVTLLLTGRPAPITVTADGYEPVNVDPRQHPSSIGLRPLAFVQAALPAVTRAILQPNSPVRVFLSNSHMQKPREVPATIAEQGISFRVEAGTWRGAALIDGRHIAAFGFSVAPAESRIVDTLSPFAIKTRLWAPVREDGTPVAGVTARWRFAEAISTTQSPKGARKPSVGEPGLTRLCEEILEMETKRSPSNTLLRTASPHGEAVKASLSIDSPGLRRLSLSPQTLAANDSGEAIRLVMRGLPMIKITVPKARRGDDLPLAATISALTQSNDEGAPGTKVMATASVVPGDVLSIRALADADHRIELRDGRARMQGLARVSRADRDWPQDVITRSVRREDRTITGTVSWGASPLVGARIVALYLGDGPQTRHSDVSVDDFSLPFDRVFESGDETAADGRFTLTVFVPGAYRVMAYHPDLKTAKSSPPIDLGEAKYAETEIRIRDGYVVLDLRDDETGKPVVGALAVIKSKSKTGEEARASTIRLESDADGLIRVADLFAGPVDIQISAKGYRRKRIEASPLSTTPIEVRRENLLRAPSCEIRFLDETGMPLVGAQAFAIGAEAGRTIFPMHQDLGESDDAGFVSVDSPADGFPHFLGLAAGKRLKFIPTFFTPVGCGQTDLVFEGQRVSILPQLRTSKGDPIVGAKVALATGGLFLPWNLMARLGELGGSTFPGSYMTTGRNGEIQLAGVLENGLWQAFAFKVEGGHDNELQKQIGSFELPLSGPTTIVLTGGKK